MPKFYHFLAPLALISAAGALASVANSAELTNRASEVEPELLPVAVARPVDVTFTDTLHAGETLSELLARTDLEADAATALLRELREFQDPRRLQSGAVVAWRKSLDSGLIRRVDFRLDADHTLNLLRDPDGWSGSVHEVEVTLDTVVVSGVVSSSLYNALVSDRSAGSTLEERNRLVDQLADRIFAWQIDFSRDLRSGDQFRVLYERVVRPDGTTRDIHVLGAQMNINRRDFEAYAFTAGSEKEDYFNREGDSLRRAFLRAPLQYRRISSAFSRSRFHPILQTARPHNGIDYAAATGTPVYAVGDGVIQRAGNGGSFGNLIEIGHSRGMMTRYAHLNGFAKGIRAGMAVKQGDLIGYVGMTGQATGPHLHFEFHRAGRPVDPGTIEDTNGDPIPRSYTAQFLERVQEYIVSLNDASRPVLAADARATAVMSGASD
ncbi:MAG: peptidoglycan DD-metalloendopeptidase family protein [Gemmatimonadota bacterium]|jgi:murein DD-endopeptidase MepM/ murein hydrolase activator NlpD|nr:peptidoglycan DD-metalloendopeptidase family protein [Gemmatimonadota bacterium]